MIGLGFSILIFTALISYNYISKTQNNTVLVETLFYMGIGALITGEFNKVNKSKEKKTTTDPDFTNISQLLGYKLFPLSLSICLACLDSIILFLFFKIIHKCSIIALLNIVTLIYLLYMARLSSLGDLVIALSLVHLYLNAFPFIITETYPTELNFLMKFGKGKVIVLSNSVFKTMVLEIIMFTVCLILRYAITWIFLKIYRQRLLIYSMNYIQEPVFFSGFCDAYFNQHPLFRPHYYGFFIICIAFLVSFAEYRIPQCLYSLSHLTIIHIIYGLSIICLFFILISYNKKSNKKYEKYIQKFADFVRDYNQNNTLKLEAKNKGSSLRQSRTCICGLMALFSLILWSIKMYEVRNLKISEDSVFHKIFVFNRLEMGYLSIYLYFGVLYTFYGFLTFFAG